MRLFLIIFQITVFILEIYIHFKQNILYYSTQEGDTEQIPVTRFIDETFFTL